MPLKHVTLYSTWKQVATTTKPATYLLVLFIWMKPNGTHTQYDLLNLDGNLITKEILPAAMDDLIEKGAIIPWTPKN